MRSGKDLYYCHKRYPLYTTCPSHAITKPPQSHFHANLWILPGTEQWAVGCIQGTGFALHFISTRPIHELFGGVQWRVWKSFKLVQLTWCWWGNGYPYCSVKLSCLQWTMFKASIGFSSSHKSAIKRVLNPVSQVTTPRHPKKSKDNIQPCRGLWSPLSSPSWSF